MNLDRESLWDVLFSEEWAEIVVPTISPAGKQIIGCLMPMGKRNLSETLRLAREYAGDQTDAAIVTKGLGKRNRPCLSIVHHFSGVHLSQAELTRAAENLRGQILQVWGMPSTIVRYISKNSALLRLT